VEALGASALASQCDLRDEASIAKTVHETMTKFGRVDILVNNASALWWQDMVDTPLKKFDLIHSINARGAFAMTQACFPHMAANAFGRVITMSPPITTDMRMYKGKTAYFMSKFGMTMVALGAGAEGKGKGVTGNALWPATVNFYLLARFIICESVRLRFAVLQAAPRPDTHPSSLPPSLCPSLIFSPKVIESQAAKNFQLGDESGWRKATILADCVESICREGKGHF
jgi:NAD(P)-dependent dehydrogenase (short-subunit alcohol dehydrogenase family)